MQQQFHCSHHASIELCHVVLCLEWHDACLQILHTSVWVADCLLYRLSTAQESEFPVATVSLNITKWTLQMVRERKLSSAAKKQQSAVTAASDFYTGTFYAFYNHWKDKKCTMTDSGFVLQEIEKRATQNVMTMVKRAGTKL